MIIKYSNTDVVTMMRESFLRLNLDGDFLDISLFKKKCVIYAIENLLTHKLYIGKTVNLLSRANEYTYIARNRNTILSNPMRFSMRSIDLAICNEGILNFRMYPIMIANDRYELAQLEREFILKYDTINPEKGYNDEIPDGISTSEKINSHGFRQPITAKMKKSKLVACVNPDEKIFIISIGMKLFGDFIGSSKDQVKNCAKRGIRHHGYYIIYLNDKDHNMIRDQIVSKLNNFETRQAELISAGGRFGGYSYNNYNDYLITVSNIEILLDDRTAYIFSKAGYKCYFLTYNTESDDITYKFEDISVFFDSIED